MNENNKLIRSDETHKLFEALSKFQGAVNTVSMNSTVSVQTKTGGNYSFKYATLPQIIESVKDELSKNGLGVTQLLSGKNITTLLTYASGQFIGSEAEIYFNATDPQKLGSLVSYFRRYAYVAILGLVSDEDDDGNIASGNSFEKKELNTGKQNTVGQVGPECPDGHGRMLKRSGKDGGYFWGCKAYPECNKTAPHIDN